MQLTIDGHAFMQLPINVWLQCGAKRQFLVCTYNIELAVAPVASAKIVRHVHLQI